jgi:hypothetical protein
MRKDGGMQRDMKSQRGSEYPARARLGHAVCKRGQINKRMMACRIFRASSAQNPKDSR